MADNPLPKPQSDDEPHTDPNKTGYDARGEDTPVTPAHNDEPVTGPVKSGYDAEGED